MLADWIIEVERQVDGRAFTARFGETQGRKLRARIAAGRPLSDEKVVRLIGDALRALPPILGVSKGALPNPSDILTVAKPYPGALSTLAAGLESGQDKRGEWVRKVGLVDQGAQFDTLSERLRGPAAAEDVNEVRTILLKSRTLSDEHWLCPCHDVGMRSELERATTWDDMLMIIARLQYNAVMSFMSLWDIAYTNAVFSDFRPTPVFLLVAPRVRPNIQRIRDSHGGSDKLLVSGNKTGFRHVVDVPFSLLFDVVVSLLRFRWSGKFPPEKIALKDMAVIFCKATKKIDRLRSGRDQLTIWEFSNLHRENYIFTPLLYAAHTWMLKLRLPERRDERGCVVQRQMIIPDGTYLRFWNRHRNLLQARGYTLNGGTTPWPEYLVNRQGLGVI